ncbi:hypothetical protein E2C01_004064 [Portunus trituberculatus]|uniref:Uncharacterized protein n=1 Tax=Portunus trituberculatus TaxID=210409 RepID=A0A5B7CPJ2_PORTR|nr:hypothetical protein [Portunus trituberculatus]
MCRWSARSVVEAPLSGSRREPQSHTSLAHRVLLVRAHSGQYMHGTSTTHQGKRKHRHQHHQVEGSHHFPFSPPYPVHGSLSHQH